MSKGSNFAPDGHTEAVGPERGGGAILQQTNLFEMRRLKMLSNTIFGVAITLLAWDPPDGPKI